MKRLTKIFAALALTAALGGALAGCSDEPVAPSVRPGLEQTEDYTVSSFSIDAAHFGLPDGTTEVELALISAEGATHCFSAAVEEDEPPMRRFHMRIPEGYELPDGEYVMTMRAGGRTVAGRLLATFSERRLAAVSIILPGYMLPGSGTEDDPYIIADSEAFEMFIINLGDDRKTNGAGLFFRQTGDVTPTDQSSLASGRGYWGAPFAGCYDGGGHEMKNLYYRGSARDDSDTGFGLFTELRGTATVSGISFTGVNVSGLYADCGILAGTTSGNVVVSDISIAGTFGDSASGRNIGGIAGHCVSGSLQLSGVTLAASVLGEENVGGLIGLADAEVSVDGVATPDYHFSVSGSQNIGGVIGRTNARVEISDVRVEHKVSDEDSDIRIIEAKGSNAGGVIGYIENAAGESRLTGVRIICPVGGKGADNVGGLVGALTNASTLTLDDCRVYSIVGGRNCVGGLIGNCYIADCLTIEGDDFSTRVAVDDAAASVSGDTYVGGLIGQHYGAFHVNTKVKVNLPVSSSGNYVGGVIGDAYGVTLDPSKIMVGDLSSASGSDPVMKVSGGNYVGGFFGQLFYSTISGQDAFDFAENGLSIRVPDVNRFTPVFSSVVKGNDCVGGVAGIIVGSKLMHMFADCRVDGTSNLGGLVGMINDISGECNVEDCTFAGLIDAPDSSCVGGIAGRYHSSHTGRMRDCVNYADITGGDNTGGVVGYVLRVPLEMDTREATVDIAWCVNMGDVSGSLHVGGVAGRVHVQDAHKGFPDDESIGVALSNCMNAGGVTASGGSSNSASSGVGGIAGFTNFRISITSCANHGPIYAKGAVHGVGGVAGSMGGDPTGTGLTNSFRNVQLSQCCNTGVVDSGSSASYVGGVLGYQEEGNKSDVRDCYNTGAVNPKLSHDAGGIVGCVDHMTNIYRCVNSGKVAHGNAAIGTHKSASLFDHGSLYYLEGTGSSWPSATKVSAADFTNPAKFGGLDFNDVWQMGTDGPQLRVCLWQTHSS